MTDIKEKLSALYDGELEKNEIDDVLLELNKDDGLKEALSYYSMASLSLSDKKDITHISAANKKISKFFTSNLWLSNSITAAASIILTIFVVNNADFTRMNISADSTNKIASAINSKEAKEIAATSDEFLTDHVMNVINDPSFMNSDKILDLRNVGFISNNDGNFGYTRGKEKFKLRIENKDFGLKKIKYWKHGNKMIYLVPISNGRVVTIYGNLSASSALQIANSIK